jgi:hypothetical protein
LFIVHGGWQHHTAPLRAQHSINGMLCRLMTALLHLRLLRVVRAQLWHPLGQDNMLMRPLLWAECNAYSISISVQ